MEQSEATSVEKIQPELALEREGVLTYRWKLSYGEILIEVFPDQTMKVNGKPLSLKSAADNDV